MKRPRDTNNNNSNNNTTTTNNTTEQNSMLSNGSLHERTDEIDSDSNTYSSFLNQNQFQQQSIYRNEINDQISSHNNNNSNNQSTPSPSKFLIQNNNNINTNSLPLPSNPCPSIFNGDLNQLTAMIQSYLTKFGSNQIFSPDTINPLIYSQFMNASTMFMQHLLTNQNGAPSLSYDPTKFNPYSTSSNNQSTLTLNIDLPNHITHSERNSQMLQHDSNIFLPKTRPMTQDEIAKNARLVYQRALQRNQIQQQNNIIKHDFYDTSNIKKDEPSMNINTVTSINNNKTPTVPNVALNSTCDRFDTIITSPLSCISNKELNVNAALSSLSLVSDEDMKMINNIGSRLDPSAPIFIPRQSRLNLHDDEIDASSSSSDSDLNDFHYVDQFLEEFYHSESQNDKHLIVHKALSSEILNIGDELLNNDKKNPIKHNMANNIHGQGDSMEQLTCRTMDKIAEQSSSINVKKSDFQYSIYELLKRYSNPRSHLVLPEWSRLSLILPNVCSMRAHKYKIKRYFAYCRRSNENQYSNNNLAILISTKNSI